eukprot:31198-Pelagococcus_subviridis.AAC.57
MSNTLSYECKYAFPQTHSSDNACAPSIAVAWSPRACANSNPASVSSALISGAYGLNPVGETYAIIEVDDVTETFRRYTESICAALATAAPERMSGRAELRYDTGSTPELCFGGAMPSNDAPSAATSAWSTSHLVASFSPHSISGVGASFPLGRQAAFVSFASDAAPTPAPHAMNGVSVHSGSPSPCPPRRFIPWSAVNTYAVPPPSFPKRVSNASCTRRATSSTARTAERYPSPCGLCACPALSTPRRCSKNTTRSPSSAACSERTFAPDLASSSVTFPRSTSWTRSRTYSSSAAWSLDAAKSSMASSYARARMCEIPDAKSGTTDGAPIAQAADD